VNEEYFSNYCERGIPYEKCWKDHSGFLDCVTSINKLGIKQEIHTVLVLGSADSSILDAFEQAHFLPDGIEIYSSIAPKSDPRVRIGDFLREVPEVFRDRIVYDLIFSNSLLYLEQNQIIPFLGFCSQLSPYFHYSSSVAENPAPDACRKILISQTNWDELFELAGWDQTSEPYLYKSRMY